MLESVIGKSKEKTLTCLIQTGESFSLNLKSAFSTMGWSVPCVNKAKAAASGRQYRDSIATESREKNRTKILTRNGPGGRRGVGGGLIVL